MKMQQDLYKIIAEAACCNAHEASTMDGPDTKYLHNLKTLKKIAEDNPEIRIDLWEEAFCFLQEKYFFTQSSNYEEFYICGTLFDDTGTSWIKTYDWDCITEIIDPIEDFGLEMDSQGNWCYPDDIDECDREY